MKLGYVCFVFIASLALLTQHSALADSSSTPTEEKSRPLRTGRVMSPVLDSVPTEQERAPATSLPAGTVTPRNVENELKVVIVKSTTDDVNAPADEAVPYGTPITQEQYCLACHAVVEEFYRWSLENMKAQKLEIHMPQEQIVKQFCESPPFNRWYQYYTLGCTKLINEHFNQVLEPFVGEHATTEFFIMSTVLKQKQKACPALNACPQLEEEMKPKKACQLCDYVTRDLHYLLSRELVVNEKRIKDVLSRVCAEIPMRHKRATDLQEWCSDAVEDYSSQLIKHIKSIYNLKNGESTTFKQLLLFESTCIATMKVCPDGTKQIEPVVLKQPQLAPILPPANQEQAANSDDDNSETSPNTDDNNDSTANHDEL